MTGKKQPCAAAAAFAEFAAEGRPAAIERYGAGHIHDTWRVRLRSERHPGYILQRINGRIFADIPGLMANLVRVTEHLRRRLAAIPGADPGREVLTVVPARNGAPFLRDASGECWRCFVFIDHCELGARPGTPAQAREAGRLFGRFLALLADLPAPPLRETIPRFHDLARRLDDFRRALAEDRVGRRDGAAVEIDFAAARGAALLATLEDARRRGLPLRTTHNDTKFNNVLIDARGRGLCVIDLDTVMPGHVLYDFGDAIRSSANTGREDEADLDRVTLNLDVFRDFAAGYLGELRGVLGAGEIGLLAFAARLMTFMIGLRFLSDHLDGDRYFRCERPGHNLQRARVQFRLLEEMERSAAAMERIVAGLAATC
jgi:Ser/Thr protein kinase RdoA (MazF antagonist)